MRQGKVPRLVQSVIPKFGRMQNIIALFWIPHRILNLLDGRRAGAEDLEHRLFGDIHRIAWSVFPMEQVVERLPPCHPVFQHLFDSDSFLHELLRHGKAIVVLGPASGVKVVALDVPMRRGQ